MSGVLEGVRAACAGVAERARFVHVAEPALERFAEATRCWPPPGDIDPAHHHLGAREETLAYIVTLDAINFGSGWFPRLTKLPGHSGYLTIATHLKRAFERDGAFDAAALGRFDAEGCAELLGQAGNEAVAPLMGLFAQALRDLGDWLGERHGGSFARAVAAADGRAERLVADLAGMPLYRDVARHDGHDVPLYKRAQLTASDLAVAFAGEGPGRFVDLDQLTIFADNLVPHVLRREGVLVYDAGLAARIERGERIPAGSPEEVEIRAVALHAVERTVARRRALGAPTTAQALDQQLWHRGQDPRIKAHPRHRTQSAYY